MTHRVEEEERQRERKSMENENKNNMCAKGKKPRADIKFCDMRPLNLHKENIFSSFLSFSELDLDLS